MPQFLQIDGSWRINVNYIVAVERAFDDSDNESSPLFVHVNKPQFGLRLQVQDEFKEAVEAFVRDNGAVAIGVKGDPEAETDTDTSSKPKAHKKGGK